MFTHYLSHIQERGLQQLMKAGDAVPGGHLRRSKVPAKLKFDAIEYFLIDWADCSISEPPVMKAMTDVEFWELITIKFTPTVLFPTFIVKTQVVKRAVKLVTDTSKGDCGTKSRNAST